MSLIYGVQHHIIQTTTTIGMITYRIAKAVTNSNSGTFCHLVLSDTEHVEGCKLGIDYWSDTCCAGKH